MNLSSANIALTILKNDPATLATPTKAVDKVVATSKAQAVASSNDPMCQEVMYHRKLRWQLPHMPATSKSLTVCVMVRSALSILRHPK